MLKKAVFYFPTLVFILAAETASAAEMGEIKHVCLALDQNIEGASVLNLGQNYLPGTVALVDCQ